MNVLIIGLGSIARKHIAAIKVIDPTSHIYALRSTRSSQQETGVINLFEKNEIPKDIDFIIVSNPTSCHATTINDVLDLNKPLFVEKPVFESLTHDDIVKKVNDNGNLTYVACNLRFLDCLTFLKNFISNNPTKRINEVNVYCGSYLPEWRPGIDFRKCYSAIPELGGGVHIDLIHEIDYVYWLFGKPEKVMSIFRNVSTLEIPAIDYANYSLVYPHFVASIILNYYRRDYKRCIEIVFDDTTWTLDLKLNSIMDNSGILIFKGENDFLSTYELQMRYFIGLIKAGGKSENDIRIAYDVLNICLNHE